VSTIIEIYHRNLYRLVNVSQDTRGTQMKIQFNKNNQMWFVYLPTKIVNAFKWTKSTDFDVRIMGEGILLTPKSSTREKNNIKKLNDSSNLPDFNIDDRNRRFDSQGHEI
jgi:hypothetical protein